MVLTYYNWALLYQPPELKAEKPTPTGKEGWTATVSQYIVTYTLRHSNINS